MEKDSHADGHGPVQSWQTFIERDDGLTGHGFFANGNVNGNGQQVKERCSQGTRASSRISRHFGPQDTEVL